jgi:hypothetical protein
MKAIMRALFGSGYKGLEPPMGVLETCVALKASTIAQIPSTMKNQFIPNP